MYTFSKNMAAAHITFSFEGMTFDPDHRELVREERIVTLTTQESLLLGLLLESDGRVVTRTRIVEELWPDSRYGDFDKAIAGVVSRLRRALGEDSQQFRCIKTVHKAGYRFTCAVEKRGVGVSVLPLPALADPALPAGVLPPAQPDAAPSPIETATEPASSSTSSPGAGVSARLRWTILSLLVALVLGAAAWLWASHRQANNVETIGLLPFSVTGDTPVFAETLRGEIANTLVTIPGVEVRAAQTLTPDLERDPLALKKTASRLGLNLILTGNLQLSATHYDVSFELIRASDLAHLRSFHYDGPRIGLSTVSDEVGSRMFAYFKREPKLTLPVPSGDRARLEAYDLAFQGTTALLEQSKASLQRAIDLYTRATELDPTLSKAYSGLAESEVLLTGMDKDHTTPGSYELARKAALRAIALNPDNAQAHSVLGLVLIDADWNLSGAAVELRQATRLNSGQTANHTKLVLLYTLQGKLDKAEAELAIAHSLDPERASTFGTGVFLHNSMRNYAAAVRDGLQFVELRPSWGAAHRQLGWAYWYSGQHRQAIDEWIEAAHQEHNTALEAWERNGLHVLETEGLQAYARAKLEDFSSGRMESSNFMPSEWAAFAGDADRTMAELDAMEKAHKSYCLFVPLDPAYDFLHQDERYKRFLATLKAQIR